MDASSGYVPDAEAVKRAESVFAAPRGIAPTRCSMGHRAAADPPDERLTKTGVAQMTSRHHARRRLPVPQVVGGFARPGPET